MIFCKIHDFLVKCFPKIFFKSNFLERSCSVGYIIIYNKTVFFMAEIDLKKMSSTELVEAVKKNNSLASEFDRLDLWEEFSSWQWSYLLKAIKFKP